MRSAMIGAVLAVVVLVGTLTFGTNLTNLVSHPTLYGWNWNYELVSGYGSRSPTFPQKTATRLLDRDLLPSPRGAAYLDRVGARRPAPSRHATR